MRRRAFVAPIRECSLRQVATVDGVATMGKHKGEIKDPGGNIIALHQSL